ncbi:MAG: hypothetical protein EPO39_13810 [Candidatus Manganitrophaceae bacterium]|nr:MAG: hypothetical protein EPO39_13810 [Candidatus Manganitrophaceae bacterium]
MMVSLLIRWVHFVAGIAWIGLLYYFNWVLAPFLKEADAATKRKVIQGLLPRALLWFRWSALLTVVAGGTLLGRVGLNTPLLIGASLGFFMLLNTWLVIWPHQQKVLRLYAESAARGTPLPAVLTLHERVVSAATRVNFYLSFPTLLFMGMSAHFPQF